MQHTMPLISDLIACKVCSVYANIDGHAPAIFFTQLDDVDATGHGYTNLGHPLDKFF